MNRVKNHLQEVKTQITQIAQQCQRDPNSIELIAVTKTKSVDVISEAINAGHCTFGENYVQEAIGKISFFQEANLQSKLIWHFIGPLQSNKTKLVAEYFDWVHTVDRLKIAQRLSDQRPNTMAKLNVLIQINISEEESKSGILPHELSGLIKQVKSLSNLSLRGLMAIPEIEQDERKQLAVFSKMQQLFLQSKREHPLIDTLSMGMSNDMKAAIMAGSTMVRIGTAIFGSR